MTEKIRDKDMNGIISKIAIHEYFLEHSNDLWKLDSNTSPLVWRLAIDFYKSSLKYDRLALKPGDSKGVKDKKKELAITYLNYLEAINTFVFKTYYEILNKLYEKDSRDPVLNSYLTYENLFTCFEILAPNFKFLDVIDSRNFELSNREEFLQILREKTEFFKKEAEVTDLLENKVKFEDFFDKTHSLDRRLRQFIEYFNDYLEAERIFNLPEEFNGKKNDFDPANDEPADEDDDDEGIEDSLNSEDKEIIKNFEKGFADYLNSKLNNISGKPPKRVLPIEEAVSKNFANVIGMNDEKELLIENAKFILKSVAPTDLTYMLYGEPGVGKSMFVECASKSFYDAGFLKNPLICRVTGAELQGKYVGHSIPNLKKTFEDYNQGTIFVDEAYTLFDPKGSSFSKEILGQLMLELEKIRTNNWNDKTMFVMAGYEDKMKQLVNENSGLESRITEIIKFNNYNNDEMFNMFEHFLNNNKFYIQGSQEKALKDLFVKFVEERRAMPNFANVRLARVIADQTMKKQSRRAAVDEYDIKVSDLEKAIDAERKKMPKEKQEEKHLIGFGQQL